MRVNYSQRSRGPVAVAVYVNAYTIYQQYLYLSSLSIPDALSAPKYSD